MLYPNTGEFDRAAVLQVSDKVSGDEDRCGMTKSCRIETILAVAEGI